MKAEIVSIIDRSGSMMQVRDDAIGGFNKFLEEQKEVEGEATLTLVLFNDKYNMVHENVPIEDVDPLDKDTYVPQDWTALLDAVGATIDKVGNRLEGTPDSERPDKVIVAILTDGMENASKDYTRDRVKSMIEHQREKYSWEFVFLGANMDAVTEAVSMGMTADAASNYVSSRDGTRSAFESYSSTVSRLRAEEEDEKNWQSS